MPSWPCRCSQHRRDGIGRSLTAAHVFAYRLLQLKQTDLAIQTFERVLDLRSSGSQSYRDLAIVFAHRAERPPEIGRVRRKLLLRLCPSDRSVRPDVQKTYWHQGVANRTDCLGGSQPDHSEGEDGGRYEYPALAPTNSPAGHGSPCCDHLAGGWNECRSRVHRALGRGDLDRHELTTIGGSVNLYSDQGTGAGGICDPPGRTIWGEYKIDTNYYDAGRAELLGAATVYVDVFTNYGRPNQRHKSLIIHLQPSKETISLGKVEFHPPAPPRFNAMKVTGGTATTKKGGRQATAMRFQWKGFIELPLGEKGVKGRFRLVGNHW